MKIPLPVFNSKSAEQIAPSFSSFAANPAESGTATDTSAYGEICFYLHHIKYCTLWRLIILTTHRVFALTSKVQLPPEDTT